MLALILLFAGLAAGQVDPTFTASLTGGGNPAGFVVHVQPDDKILVGGQFRQVGGFARGNIARLTSDGSIDLTFTPAGYIEGNPIFEFDMLPDGKVLVAGFLPRSDRLNPDGTLNLQFIGASESRDIKHLPEGKTLVATSITLRRWDNLGSPDTSFVSVFGNHEGRIYKMVLQPDGKIIIVGLFTSIISTPRGRIARVNANGGLDTTFSPVGANAAINTVVLQSDGKIIIGGDFTSFNSDSTKKYLARLNSDGSLDTSFSPVLDAPVLALKVQSDRRILVGGAMSMVNGAARSGIARLNQDGTLDTSFDIGTGTNGPVWSIDQQSDGKIVYSGQFTNTNGVQTLGIGRLLNVRQPALFDFDGDGRADVSVFRPSENKWYVFRSSDNQVLQQVFAVPGDVPVPADYDGDDKTDFAIYRPSSGDWWYLSSFDGTAKFAHWGGEAGDVPRPSDFDGDGRTDFVIFRPTNNFWYRISNLVNGTVSNVQFGLAGDKPVRGDFDGDGKSDVAIFRPSMGDWWYQSSINNAQLAVRWGISTDIPVPADFDGDGKTDFAVFRPSTGVWYVINSSNGSFLIGPFGTPEDKPVPADYDGDGKAELAVFRPSTGIWYQLRTSGGFFAMQFGVGTDTPAPNAFVP